MNNMRVVNCTREACTHYCGRPSSLNRAIGHPVDLSILGNPHWMADESQRERVCALYRRTLFQWIIEDKPGIVEALRSLPEDAILGCFCAPRQCHCDILEAASNYVKATRPQMTTISVNWSKGAPMR
jgi:hypothetical protein